LCPNLARFALELVADVIGRQDAARFPHEGTRQGADETVAERDLPLLIFYAYSHEDDALRQELSRRLAGLEDEGVTRGWYDREIGPGEEWQKQLNIQLDAADIILLLVSPAFLASKYCMDVELPNAMSRHFAGRAKVIPIILRPARWKDTPFGTLQALPSGGEPVATWEDEEEAFADIVRGIRRVATEYRAGGGSKRRADAMPSG